MNKKGQQKIILTILITFLMLGTFFITEKQTSYNIKAEELTFVPLSFESEANVGQFGYHKTIVFDNEQINQSLTNFPVLINLTSNDLRDYCLDSGWDIAFFDESNNQLNHEIERWNYSIGKLIAWVNVTLLKADSDTTIYLYFNDSDIGASAENIEGTWGDEYYEVYHMNDTDGGADDSLGNVDINEIDSIPSSFYQQPGVAGKGITINNKGAGGGGSLGAADGLFAQADWENDWTIEYWAKRVNNTEPYTYLISMYATTQLYHSFQNKSGDQRIIMYTRTEAGGDLNINISADFIEDGSFYFYSMRFDDSENNLSNYLNGKFIGGYAQSDFFNGIHDDSFGSTYSLHTYGLNWGTLDEFRMAKTAHNESWLLTCYNSIVNATDGGFFRTQGTESSYSIKGLTNNRITFSGTAGTAPFCNTTGDYHEWLEINMSINSTDNITEIRVFMDDYNDTNAWINASNITLYVSSDNSSYGSLGTFTDGGSNISINKSTWPAGGGDNPFNGAGLTDRNTSIYCIFRMEIPSGLSTDEFYTSASDSCKIYLGYYA